MNSTAVLEVVVLLWLCMFVGACTPPNRCEVDAEKMQSIAASEVVKTWIGDFLFASQLGEDVIDAGGFVGPGKRRMRPSLVRVAAPDEMAGMEIRLIGEDVRHPDAVFVGVGAYRGFVIARSEVATILKAEAIMSNEVIYQDKTSAVICRLRG